MRFNVFLKCVPGNRLLIEVLGKDASTIFQMEKMKTFTFLKKILGGVSGVKYPNRICFR